MGARLDWVFRFGGQLTDTARLIQIDVEAAEIGRKRPVRLGLVGDAAAILKRILAALDSGLPTEVDSVWLERMQMERQARISALGESTGRNTIPMGPHRLVQEVLEAAPDDTLWCRPRPTRTDPRSTAPVPSAAPPTVHSAAGGAPVRWT